MHGVAIAACAASPVVKVEVPPAKIIIFRIIISPHQNLDVANHDNYNRKNYHRTKDETSYDNYKISEYPIISIRMMHDQRLRETLIIFIR